MKSAHTLAASIILSLCAALPFHAAAQSYPSKPIKLVVPFGPGSGSDLLGRVVGERLSEQMNVPVVVENREGAGGVIGTQYVAKGVPDGYTILLVANALTIAPHLQATPPFDPLKDFAPIAKIAVIPLAVVTSVSSPYTTMKDMIAWFKANPGRGNYASSGKGSPSHLEAAQIVQTYELAVQDVPYKNVGQAMTDTIAGQVNFYIPVLPAAMAHVKAGKLRVLATGALNRSPQFPDVPTVSEVLGIPGYEVSAWFGFVAPAGTPQEIVNRVYEEIAKAMGSPQVREKVAGIGSEVTLLDPQKFAAQIRNDNAKWGKLVKSLGIRNQ